MNNEDLIQQLRDENAALREENVALCQRIAAQQKQLGQVQQVLAAAEERQKSLLTNGAESGIMGVGERALALPLKKHPKRRR